MHDAELVGLASVRRPAYQGAEIEARQGEAAELHLVLGPVAAGKSAVLAEMLRSGAIDLAADTTRAVGIFGARCARSGDGPIPCAPGRRSCAVREPLR